MILKSDFLDTARLVELRLPEVLGIRPYEVNPTLRIRVAALLALFTSLEPLIIKLRVPVDLRCDKLLLSLATLELDLTRIHHLNVLLDTNLASLRRR